MKRIIKKNLEKQTEREPNDMEIAVKHYQPFFSISLGLQAEVAQTKTGLSGLKLTQETKKR